MNLFYACCRMTSCAGVGIILNYYYTMIFFQEVLTKHKDGQTSFLA